jgi:2-phosphosulfolactate phosphatase
VQINVALLPQLAAGSPADRGVCIVIDVLRATTTLTTLLELGATGVLVAPGADAARAAKADDPAAILLGEVSGLRPADFDLGNSPRELASAGVAGRRAICATSNGTAAIRGVADAPATLLGCVRNGTAVAARAFALAREGAWPVTIVCSGGAGGRAFALDDTLVAGHLALLLAGEAERVGVPATLDDAALAARTLRRAEVGPGALPPADRWEAALRSTSAGRHLAAIGLGDDIPFCAQPDRTDRVPVVRMVGERVMVGLAEPGGTDSSPSLTQGRSE